MNMFNLFKKKQFSDSEEKKTLCESDFEEIYRKHFEDVDELLEKSYYVLEKRFPKIEVEMNIEKRKKLLYQTCIHRTTAKFECPLCKQETIIYRAARDFSVYCSCPIFKTKSYYTLEDLSKNYPLFWYQGSPRR